ncbi:MAG: hypothetical protein U5N58_07820 [Actinomycetota bacterium]|nr:hypothetical protein [Actinomycetota bacterium]
MDYIKWVKVLLNGYGSPTRGPVCDLESIKRVLVPELPAWVRKDALYFLRTRV